jgi:hypothetical protein
MAHAARIQREAVAAIRSVGGTAGYEGDRPIPVPGSESRRWAPGWLVQLVGVDFFYPVDHVALMPEESAAAVPHIRHLTRIKTLFLVSPAITDGDLAYL